MYRPAARRRFGVREPEPPGAEAKPTRAAALPARAATALPARAARGRPAHARGEPARARFDVFSAGQLPLDRRALAAIGIGAFVALVGANFAFIYPILTDAVLTYQQWQARMWIRGWI